MKKGLSISTHSSENTPNGRYDIIENCLQSLIDNKPDDLMVNIISDGITNKHREIIKKFPFNHFERKENGGISKTKNTSIKTILQQGCDIGFLADDDLIFKDKEVFNAYTDAIVQTNIPHYSLFLQDDGKNCNDRVINDFTIKQTPWVNGCFLTFTKQLIENIGYFKILPYKYGHEHSNFSRRCVHQKENPYWCDIIGSLNMVNINHDSLSRNSIVGGKNVKINFNSMGDTIDQELFKLNERESCRDLDIKIKLVE